LLGTHQGHGHRCTEGGHLGKSLAGVFRPLVALRKLFLRGPQSLLGVLATLLLPPPALRGLLLPTLHLGFTSSLAAVNRGGTLRGFHTICSGQSTQHRGHVGALCLLGLSLLSSLIRPLSRLLECHTISSSVRHVLTA
jgi:hypothetical protein